MHDISKRDFLEKNALYLAKHHLTFPDVNSVVHYQMINYPSTISENLLLIPQISNQSAFWSFSLHMNSCTFSVEVGDLPLWTLLYIFHSASFWLATIIPLGLHTHSLFYSVSDLYTVLDLCLLHTHFPTVSFYAEGHFPSTFY